MAAITPGPESEKPDSVARSIRAAHESLDLAAQFAKQTGDPTAYHLGALRDMLYSLAEIDDAGKKTIAEHRMHIDRDFDAIRQARDALIDTTNHVVTAAKSEVEAAHAAMGQKLVASIGHSVEQKLASMSRMMWWRTITLGSALSIGILALGFGLGYWRGNSTGYDQAASSILASGPVERAVQADQGPAGLHQWHQFMQDNNIVQTMKTDCKGSNIAHQTGRTACHLWLWTTPFVQPLAHG
jgi:hypothetical protein